LKLGALLPSAIVIMVVVMRSLYYTGNLL
jgi:hypothetical protein